MSSTWFIIDFDSTFIRFEALDELAAIALQDDPEQNTRLNKIKALTNQAMEGKLSFPESLQKRIELLDAGKDDIEKLVRILKRNISTSIRRNEAFFKKFADHIFIISGGFKEYIAPVVSLYDIPEDHIFANTFEFDEEGRIIGFDKDNFLSQENGKVKQLKNINLEGEIYVIGDGYTDFQLKESGLADKFYNFTENIERVSLLDKADHVTPSFDEFLFKNKLPMSISYPKNRIKAYVMDNLPEEVSKTFELEGYQVEHISPEPGPEKLSSLINDASILAVNPETSITADDLKDAKRLLAIGIYGIDKGNIDLNTCLDKGIIVLHAPHTNTRSVAELALGEMIMLMRQVPVLDKGMHEGRKTGMYNATYEIAGKRLGIIGYGNVGKQLGGLAETLGMDVVFYDTETMEGLGNATPCQDMEEVLESADVVSIHVSDTEENRNLIDENALELMKEGAVLLNLSCKKAVNMQAVAKFIKNGKLGGAGIDRFPDENIESAAPLSRLPNVIMTPSVSGQTVESKYKTADYVTTNLINFINTGDVMTSVNFPDIQLPPLQGAHRLIHIHKDYPGMMAKISKVLADHDVNINAQFLKTNRGIGYLITDISRDYDDRAIKAIKEIPYAVRLRILY